MSQETGKISGSLLSNNLLRNGSDLAFETELLYLNVVDGFVGISTDTPVRPLHVRQKIKTTNLIVDTQVDFPNYTISSNIIQNNFGTIYIQPLQLNPEISTERVATANLKISNQLIENYIADSDIQMLPIGSGVVHFTTDTLDIYGNLHSTGSITADGSIIFGNTAGDNVVFNSDISSKLNPNIDDTYDLGSISSEWNTLYSYNLLSNIITTDNSLIVNDIDLLTTPGNTIYVSINGSDTNYGTHQHSTFRSIKHALSVATSGDEIVIYPGTYVEDFPLTVPQGVTVRGSSIRAITIEPTPSTNTNDAFLLNGDTTVEFVTIQNFFEGYAFKFAPNFKTIARSPYVYNVTVITRGSVTSVSDPLGYNEGDAGGGAYIDGSVADPTGTIPPTMLFFAATFITPNVNGIVATNGTRVEWLNSFTYFAKRGIYLLNGTLGRASLGSVFGAEMRSINSANVYGEYGAVADGNGTLGYLIGHNFGYIGVGANSDNDAKLSIQANEILTANDGVLYYDSKDHKGDFRIGDIFYINQETGDVVFNAQSINFGADGNIALEGSTSATYINKDYVQTGNIRIHGNNIDSLSGPVNFLAASGKTYLNTNVYVTGLANISADTKVSGDVFLGNDPLDLIVIVPKLDQDFNPNETNKWTLGTSTKRWNTLFGTLIDVDGVTQLTNNTVSTLTSGTDLKFYASGTGKIHVTTTDVQVNNDLTANSITNTFSYAETTHTTTSNRFFDSDIAIEDNYITTTVSAHNLELKANNTGIIDIQQSDVQIDNDLTVNDLLTIDEFNLTGTLTHKGDYFLTGNKLVTGTAEITASSEFIGEAQFYDFNINNNTIQTTKLDSDFIIGANGLGIVHVKTTNVQIDNDLTVNQLFTSSYLETTTTTTGNTFNTGDITITDNVITTTGLNHDLRLLATGQLHIDQTDVQIDNKLTVNSLLTLDEFNINGTLTHKGDYFLTGNKLVTGTAEITLNADFIGEAQLYDFNINDNIIKTTRTDSDLKLAAPLSKLVRIKTTDVQIDNDLTVTNNLTINGSSDLQSVDINGDVILIGDFHQTGDLDLTGTFGRHNIILNGDSYVDVPNIRIYNNQISITATDTDLKFTANGTGGIVLDNKLKITDETISNVWSGAVTNTQKSIILSPNGTSNATINSTKSLVLPIGNNTTRTLTQVGEIRYNSLSNMIEGWRPSGYVNFMNLWDSDRNTYITAELTPGANDSTLRFGINGTVRATINETALATDSIHISGIELTQNLIKPLNTSNDLTLTVSGSGTVNFNNVKISNNTITNPLDTAITLETTGPGYVKFAGTGAVVFPYGTTDDRRDNPEVGEVRNNSTLGYMEVFDGTNWIKATGNNPYVNAAEAEEIMDFWILVLG